MKGTLLAAIREVFYEIIPGVPCLMVGITYPTTHFLKMGTSFAGPVQVLC